jgi:hypothetical protein
MVTAPDDARDEGRSVTGETRAIQCNGKHLTLRRFPDGVLGVFDEGGRMIVGWPETAMFGARPLDEGDDAEWCATIGRVRKIG